MASDNRNLKSRVDEWDRHRATITRLYVAEKKTLKEVMAIMERHYHFSKSLKLYKTRFKVWGISKNLLARDVPAMLHELAATEQSADSTTTFVIRGRKVSQAKVERFLKRTMRDCPTLSRVEKEPAGNKRKLQEAERFSLLTRLPTRIDLPDQLRLPEELIQISHHYIAGGCEGAWVRDANSKVVASPAIIEWNCQMYTAITSMHQGEWQQAFAMLNACFDHFKYLLADPMPIFFIQFYIIVLWLPPDIGTRLLGYASQLSKILLPANHPLCLAFAKLSQAGIRTVHEHAWVILSSHLQILGEWFRECVVDIFEFNAATCRCLSASCLNAVNATNPWPGSQFRRVGWTDIYLRSQLSITWILYYSKEYGQAADALDAICQKADQTHGILSHSIGKCCADLISGIRQEMGRLDGSIPVADKEPDCPRGICRRYHSIPAMQVTSLTIDGTPGRGRRITLPP